jgi:Dynamin family
VTERAGEPSTTERAVRRLLHDALDTYADDTAVAAALARHLERLDEPLRVAIAGKLKAGKSTLLNALVGEEIAPTDATECTRVVTWYEHGAAPRITVHPSAGPPAELPVVRAEGRLQLDLGGHEVGEVDHLTVAWPARSLRAATLIDTPGIDSLSLSISRRTLAFLAPEDEPSDADAMIYLIRHLHDSDLRLLESFRDTACGRATMINTIGVLARADEIGGGRIDSLISAGAIAARYREHPTIRQLCSTVVPVVGLLAQAGRTLRQAEYEALEVLAGEPRQVTNSMLLSVDRFIASDAPVPLPSDRRTALIDRLGLFGVRLALTFVRSGMRDPTVLATELVRRSGLDELRQLLATQFTARSGVLKARSTMLALSRLMRAHPRRGTESLAADLERIVAGAHEMRELALLSSLRAGRISFAEFGAGEDRAAERLLGASGSTPAHRLGLGATATDADARAEATEAIQRWRARAQSALVDRHTADGCLVVARSCEGVLAELPGGAARPAS